MEINNSSQVVFFRFLMIRGLCGIGALHGNVPMTCVILHLVQTADFRELSKSQLTVADR